MGTRQKKKGRNLNWKAGWIKTEMTEENKQASGKCKQVKGRTQSKVKQINQKVLDKK